MKLILASNQTEKFVDFYDDLRSHSAEQVEYTGYTSLLYLFDSNASSSSNSSNSSKAPNDAPKSSQPVKVINVTNGRLLNDYSGVYINGYLNCYELAAATAICCDALDVPFVNRELRDAPSLSKLTMYAKLASAKVSLPYSVCGTKAALLQAEQYLPGNMFPAVLKRADMDRGIDNFKVMNYDEITAMLENYDDTSIWALQRYIENDGFYMVCCYDGEPAFSVFRSLEPRPDGDVRKAHMYKPKGGVNASLLDVDALSADLIDVCRRATSVMNRQIASVDCVVDAKTQRAFVLEVNYNPQLVTIETFKDVRKKAFLEYIGKNWE
jgi:glutathione synthase/RimK-type ligase-like ATP-grasp enzyme